MESASVGGSPAEAGGGCGSLSTRTLAAVLGSTPWHEPSQSPPLAPPKSQVAIFYLFIYLFIYFHHARSSLRHADFLVVACRLLVAACGLLSCGMHVGSSSLTREQTRAPCIGSAESYPLYH